MLFIHYGFFLKKRPSNSIDIHFLMAIALVKSPMTQLKPSLSTLPVILEE